jgi:hypothetical protein
MKRIRGMTGSEHARLDKIEAMLQVSLEAICVLATRATGTPMVIGHSGDSGTFGATPLSKNVKWTDPQALVSLSASPVESGPKADDKCH